MIKFEMKGMGTMKKRLREMERQARTLDGKHDVPFDELFSSSFMQKYTSHPNFGALLVAGGYDVNSKADFEAIPDDEWDVHISKHTRFSSWSEMQKKAALEWTSKKLGF